MMNEYFQVRADEVYQSAGFVSVSQAPPFIRPEPHIVGWNGRFTFYDMPVEQIAHQMSDWLIQENERLKDEVEELKMDLEKARQQCEWQSGWENERGTRYGN